VSYSTIASILAEANSNYIIGDGRVILALARALRCKGYGWDISKECIETAKAMSGDLSSLVAFHEIDFTIETIENELRDATVIFAYLPVIALQKIRPLIQSALAANPKARLITNEYHYPDIEKWSIISEDGPIRISRLAE
jgi:hypothetical protein